jgi:hypothetical protein
MKKTKIEELLELENAIKMVNNITKKLKKVEDL